MSEPQPALTTDDTRQRLVAAAAAVFAERGYDRAGVQEIARRAGLTTGAIYGRFRGKSELLQAAIVARTDDEFDELFSQQQVEGGQASAVLRTVGSHLVLPAEDDTEGTLLLEAFVAARRDDEVLSILRSVLDDRAALLAEVVETAKADGSIDPGLDTESVVRFCHAVGLGFLLYDAISLPLPASAPWEQLISRLVAALAPEPSKETQSS